MKKPYLPAILALAILALGSLAAWAAATASFTTPPQPGNVFAVINADRSPGARTTSIAISWGPFQKTVVRGNPYGNCAGSIAGFVLMVPNRGLSAPFVVTSNGSIVRPPYQGVQPPEVGHACYDLERVKFRAPRP